MFLYNMHVRKLLSDNSVECSGNCRECTQYLKLWCCDAEDGGGSSVCSTRFDC